MDEGKRFSLVYLERTAPIRDSDRFRNRLAAYYLDHLHEQFRRDIKIRIEKETGATVPFTRRGDDVAAFLQQIDLRDVLDSITLIYEMLAARGYHGEAQNWKNFVGRVLREENLGYQLDSHCGVHYLVDEEFERNRFATLTVLDDPKYSGVRAAFEDAYRYMDSDPIDTKAAVRSMFESLEILVRQMVSTKNLNKWVVENTLKEKCLKVYEGDETGLKVVSELFNGFALWVDGLHNYRHGQATEEPVAPTEGVAVYVLSSGSSFLRWLIGINNHLSKNI